MHTALRISEVLRYICDYVDDGTLLAMARTARVLHEPAIEMIWFELPSLVHLFKCFPEDTWALHHDEDDEYYVSTLFLLLFSVNAHVEHTRLNRSSRGS